MSSFSVKVLSPRDSGHPASTVQIKVKNEKERTELERTMALIRPNELKVEAEDATGSSRISYQIPFSAKTVASLRKFARKDNIRQEQKDLIEPIVLGNGVHAVKGYYGLTFPNAGIITADCLERGVVMVAFDSPAYTKSDAPDRENRFRDAMRVSVSAFLFRLGKGRFSVRSVPEKEPLAETVRKVVEGSWNYEPLPLFPTD